LAQVSFRQVCVFRIGSPHSNFAAMLRFLRAFALAAPIVGAVELTKETWDEAVAGKTVFVKLLAPW